eukprot:scaffold14681_cov163-Skeletonema_dohrnii-CCMP3373.AAC.3
MAVSTIVFSTQLSSYSNLHVSFLLSRRISYAANYCRPQTCSIRAIPSTKLFVLRYSGTSKAYLRVPGST